MITMSLCCLMASPRATVIAPDDEGTMGTSENINTIVRKGLKKENPEAYKVLNNFNWTTKDMESVMLDIQNGKTPEAAAKAWIKDHQKQVDKWFK